jgi:serine/threonine protein phosphatase 1
MSVPERIMVVGDIHGCLGKLQEMMKRLEPAPGRDQLVFLGDYIDRGENSRGVVDYLLGLREKHPDTIFLVGNHEKMFVDFLGGVEQALFIHNGGGSTIRSYMGSMENPRLVMHRGLDTLVLEQMVPAGHREFLRNLQLYYETPEFIMVHAGLRNGVPLEKQTADDLVWIREEFIYSELDFGKRVIFGHTPFVRPLVLPNKIGIDTGAVYGNALTCIILPDLEFVSV